MRLIHVVVVVLSLFAGGMSAQPTAATEPCAGLVRLELPGAKVVSAEIVPAGAFTPPERLSPWLVAEPGFYEKLPAFCRVVVKAAPSADSDVSSQCPSRRCTRCTSRGPSARSARTRRSTRSSAG